MELRLQKCTAPDAIHIVRGSRTQSKEIEKASNKCLPDAVLKALAKVQAPGKGVNDAGSKALKQM